MSSLEKLSKEFKPTQLSQERRHQSLEITQNVKKQNTYKSQPHTHTQIYPNRYIYKEIEQQKKTPEITQDKLPDYKVYLTFKPLNGSETHYFHFFFGVFVPLICTYVELSSTYNVTFYIDKELGPMLRLLFSLPIDIKYKINQLQFEQLQIGQVKIDKQLPLKLLNNNTSLPDIEINKVIFLKPLDAHNPPTPYEQTMLNNETA